MSARPGIEVSWRKQRIEITGDIDLSCWIYRDSDSHIKTSLFGPGLTLIVEDGALLLGTWQHVFLAEWDGPRLREVAVRVSGSKVSGET